MSAAGKPAARGAPADWADIEEDDDYYGQARPAADAPSASSEAETTSSAAEGDFGTPIQDEEDDDDLEEGPPPAHACRYCGYSHSIGVARCNTCRKWFCNNRGSTSTSHLVSHLVRSKHKEVSLHPDSPLREMILECYVCGCKNIFMLGFVPSAEDNVVVLLCREPCLASPMLKDMHWDPTTWLPLIEERQLLSWLVEVPDKKSRRAVKGMKRDLTGKQIAQLEELWKENPEATLESMLKGNGQSNSEFSMLPLQFADGEDYIASYLPLVRAEARCSKEMKEAVTYDGLKVKWGGATVTGKKVFVLEIPVTDAAIAIGDEIMVWNESCGWKSKGTAVKVDLTPATMMEITIELAFEEAAAATANSGRRGDDRDRRSSRRNEADTKHGPTVPAPTHLDTGFSMQCQWKDITFRRMENALKTMVEQDTSLSAYLYYKILGTPVPETLLEVTVPANVNVPHMTELNHSQIHAVGSVLQRPLSLIQGPPGTGKTSVSTAIVYHMCKLNKEQVLVCAPSNVAVDQLAERLDMTGLNVLRLCARSRESVLTSVDRLTLHRQVREYVERSPAQSQLRKLMKLKDAVHVLTDEDQRVYLDLLKKVEVALITNADVICATCSGAADRRLSTFRFKHVLIDETTQSTEPECLIPLVMGCRQLVLVGDHCQMGPVVMYRPAANVGYDRSLFERLVTLGERPTRLDVQYRMHPCLSEFSSNAFYEGTLQNGVTADQRDASDVFSWPDPTRPMFFYNSISPEEIGGNGTSFLNRSEAAMAEKIVTCFMANGVLPDDVGVITPYEAQRCFLVNYMARNGRLGAAVYNRIEVASVDSFQGREKEFIVLTCVRSNDGQGIGFLSDWRRLNVALTRAKRGLVIIGNARVLSRHHLWHQLLQHFKSQQLLVDGPVGDLKAMNITLQKPRKVAPSLHPGPDGLPAAPSRQGGRDAVEMDRDGYARVGGGADRRSMYQAAMSPDFMDFNNGAAAAASAAAHLPYVPGQRWIGSQMSQSTGPVSQATLSIGSSLTQDDDDD